jgi:nicotinate-nucleotide pyrophosphorylase (carboxylating)
MFLPRKILEERLRNLLTEDIGQGDITTALIVPEDHITEAEVIAKKIGVAAGIEEAKILLEGIGLEVNVLVMDGERVKPKQVLLKISGDTRTILVVERTLLNLVSRMSGIATATRNIVEKLQKTKLKVKVACTRKTAPGLLYFDKKAVFVGGGDTHRLHLDDLILIKDNHIAVASSIEESMKLVRQGASFTKKIEIEVTKEEDALVAAKAGADIVMLDNFSPKQIEKTVAALKKTKSYGKVLLEASGGITLANVLKFASTGVDVVSLGELTHSAKALNVSLEIMKVKK